MNKLKTPYELFGIECGKGWKSLYQPILDRIEEINKDNEDKIEVLQVKEKFGQLTIYLSRYTDELRGMTIKASEKSNHICEDCGKPSEPKMKDGWIYQLCNKCFDKFKQQQNKIIKSYESEFEQREENLN